MAGTGTQDLGLRGPALDPVADESGRPTGGQPSGFTAGIAPPQNVLRFYDQALAWAAYRKAGGDKGPCGYPVPATDAQGRPYWFLPRVPAPITNDLVLQQPMHEKQVSAAPTPGGSVNKAKLKPEDRARISQRVAGRAEKARAEVGSTTATEQLEQAQATLFDGEEVG